MNIEPLESRIAPATIYGLTTGNMLLSFDSATPGTLDGPTAITGLGASETLQGIDFRPATGDLVGVTVTTGSANNSVIKTYVIDSDTAVATLVGTSAALAGAGDVPTGFDFNPTLDRIRYVNTNDENARLNPNNGALAGNDTDLTPAATTTIIAAAYDHNFANALLTTLYAIDRNDSVLAIQGGIDGAPSPNGGVVTDLAPLGFTLNAANDGGFDIETGTNIGFAALTDAADDLTRLYTINLVTAVTATPVATAVGLIGNGMTEIRSLAIALPQVAVTITGGTASYVDEDGDTVTVKASQGTFEADDFRFARLESGTQLRLLDLSDDGVEFQGANITVTAKKAATGDGLANIGFIKARDTATLTGVDLGKVSVQGDLALIDVGDPTSSAASPALQSLMVRSMGRYGQVTMAGSGDLQSDIFGPLGDVKIAGDMIETSISVTAATDADARTGAITIGASLSGVAIANTGRLFSEGDMGAVKIGRDFVGGSGNDSGQIFTRGKLASVTIGGSMIGGEGDYTPVTAQSGQIFSSGNMGAVKIVGDVRGAGGTDSAAIFTTSSLASLTVGGSVIGGEGSGNAAFTAFKDIGFVKIGGNFQGGVGTFSASIFGSAGNPATPYNVTIGGSVIGGTGSTSGNIGGGLAAVKIAGDLVGGAGTSSGALGGFGNFVGVQSVTIGGSMLGGAGTRSGAIIFEGAIGSVKVGRDIVGSSINGSEAGNNGAAAIFGLRIGSVKVGGSIITGVDDSTGGALTNSAAIRTFFEIGSITVKGSLIGNSQANGTTPLIIAAGGQETPGAGGDIAIGKLTIGGSVERAQILAGYQPLLVGFGQPLHAQNGNASIGAVKIAGDWVASDLVAGIQDDADTLLDDPFGDADDQLIAGGASRIASISIKGVVLGSTASGDTFGFLAKTIGSFSALGFKAPLTPGPDGPFKLSPLTGDVVIREF